MQVVTAFRDDDEFRSRPCHDIRTARRCLEAPIDPKNLAHMGETGFLGSRACFQRQSTPDVLTPTCDVHDTTPMAEIDVQLRCAAHPCFMGVLEFTVQQLLVQLMQQASAATGCRARTLTPGLMSTHTQVLRRPGPAHRGSQRSFKAWPRRTQRRQPPQASFAAVPDAPGSAGQQRRSGEQAPGQTCIQHPAAYSPRVTRG